MAIKELQTRIALRYDSYDNWTDKTKEGLGANLVLLKGELGICEIPAVNGDSRVAPTVLFKVGDGVKTFEALPWASAKAADVYAWAKASDVRLSGKTIEFVGGKDAEGNDIIVKSIAINYATPEDVAAAVKVVADDLSDLDARVVAVENKFTGANNVQGQIDALDGRLDTAEDKLDTLTGADTVDGSVAKALKDAKAYAEGQASDVKTYVDGDFKTSIQGYADGEASAAETAAKGHADSIVATEKSAREAEDTRLAGLISSNTTAIGAVRTDFEVADTAINAKIGTVTEGKTVVGMISEAQLGAETNAAADAAAKVKALEDGKVATNASEITRVEGLVTAEAKAREDADKAIDERLVEVEAFFKTTDGETLDTALDTLKEIQDYLNGEGSATDGIISRVVQAETDIDNLEKEFNTDTGRVKVAENKIAALEAKDTELNNAIGTKLATSDFETWKGTHENGHAKTAAEITSEINTAVSGEKSAREVADALINEKFGADYSKDATVASAVADAKAAGTGAASEAARAHGRLDVVEPKVTTLQDIVDGYSTKSSIKTAVDAAQKAADDAQDAADKAQGEIDALELVVGNETTGLAATKAIADGAAAKATENAGRLDTAESEIDALQAIVSADGGNSNAKLREDITDLQTLTGDAAKGNEALHTELSRVAGLVDNTTTGLAATKAIADQNKTDIGIFNGKVTAIENDYVKASDLVGDLYVFNCGTATTVTHVVPQN